MKMILSGYEKLWLECEGVKYSEIDPRSIPPDCDTTMKHLIKTLRPKERYVLTKLCNGLTCADIAKILDLSPQRISQIKRQGICRLQSQNRYKVLNHGEAFYNCMIAERERYINDIVYPPKYLEMVDAAQKLVDDRNIEALLELRNDIDNYIKEIGGPSRRYADFDLFNDVYLNSDPDMSISLRTCNCLLRGAKCKTLGDVTKMTSSDLMKIRNLGSKSYDEIIHVLNTCGLSLKEES